MKRKARNIVRNEWFNGDNEGLAECEEMMAHNADNLALCSCSRCGNPRKWSEEKSLQERRAELDECA